MIIAPKANMLMAKLPGLLRPVLDRSFRRSSVARAIELANPTGWRDRTAIHRYDAVPASGSKKHGGGTSPCPPEREGLNPCPRKCVFPVRPS